MPHPSPPLLVKALSGEVALALAVLRQAVIDTRSRRDDVRVEAERFWQDAQAVSFWADMFDVDVGRLRQAVAERGVAP